MRYRSLLTKVGRCCDSFRQQNSPLTVCDLCRKSYSRLLTLSFRLQDQGRFSNCNSSTRFSLTETQRPKYSKKLPPDDPEEEVKAVAAEPPGSGLDLRRIWSGSGPDPFFTGDVAYGEKRNKGLGEPERPYVSTASAEEVEAAAGLQGNEEEEELSPPTNCCRSGCPNCVWIEYVEKLTQRYLDPALSRERILKDLDTIEDQCIKAFIRLELKSKGLL